MKDRSEQEIIELLRKVDLFASLSDDEIEVVAFNSQFFDYPQGSLVFTENASSQELFVVKDGAVMITKHREDGDFDLAQYIAGESFGELGLIGNIQRSATAVALKDTRLLVFPKEGVTFPMVLHKYPKISARILHKFLAIIAARIRNTHRLINDNTPWIQNLKKQMFVDKLTGLYNKNFLMEEFRMKLPSYGEQSSILMIKPDNFKELNDRYGHEAGDKVLLIMSIFMQSILREGDIAVRYSGNEFAAVLPDTGKETALKMAKDIGKALREMDISEIAGGDPFFITVSIGAATYPLHGANGTDLVGRAYEKMYKARNLGGNRIISVK